jgi:CTP synthase (UTP-ammonia lyase)
MESSYQRVCDILLANMVGADNGSQERLFDTVSIVLIGKYTSLQDSYMSVVKALEHASMRCGHKLDLQVSHPCTSPSAGYV